MQRAAAATRPRCSAPTRSASRSRRSCSKRPACKYYTTVAGFSLLSGVTNDLQRLLLRHPEAVGGARQARRTQHDGDHARTSTGSSDMLPGAQAFAFSPPAIPGVGTSGGVTFMLEDRSGKDVAVPGREHRDIPRGRAQAAGDRRGVHDLHPQRRRRCSPTWTATRCSSKGVDLSEVYKTLQAFMGGVLRQLLQPLRPAVAGLRAGRGRLPHAAPSNSASSTCATARATRCRCRR